MNTIFLKIHPKLDSIEIMIILKKKSMCENVKWISVNNMGRIKQCAFSDESCTNK